MLEIRVATPQDLDAIVGLHIDCWKQAYSTLLPHQYIESYNSTRRRKMWTNIFNANVEHIAIALWFSKPIGFINVGPDFESNNQGDYTLRSLYILNSHHNCGVGKSLMSFITENRLIDINRLSLKVLDSNFHAIHFYNSLGFVDTNHRYHEKICGAEITDIKMEKIFS